MRGEPRARARTPHPNPSHPGRAGRTARCSRAGVSFRPRGFSPFRGRKDDREKAAERLQRTIARPAEVHGNGLPHRRPVRLRFLPGAALDRESSSSAPTSGTGRVSPLTSKTSPARNGAPRSASPGPGRPGRACPGRPRRTEDRQLHRRTQRPRAARARRLGQGVRGRPGRGRHRGPALPATVLGRGRVGRPRRRRRHARFASGRRRRLDTHLFPRLRPGFAHRPASLHRRRCHRRFVCSELAPCRTFLLLERGGGAAPPGAG